MELFCGFLAAWELGTSALIYKPVQTLLNCCACLILNLEIFIQVNQARIIHVYMILERFISV